MKPFKKVIAIVLALVLIASVVGCTPISMSKQWSYDYNDDTLSEQLDIGVYIYSMSQAYNTAKTYAEKSKDYKEGESFLDLEITDDDGNKAVAKDWIKTEAEKISVSLLAIDHLVNKYDATWDEATMSSAIQQSKTAWEMGYYAALGYSQYYQPLKDELEPKGISYDSFEKSSFVASVKQDAIFDALYSEGGEKAVSDKELEKYFLDEYVAYSYIPVNMYTSETNDAGESTSVAFSKKKMDSTVEKLNAYADKLANGLSIDKVIDGCVKDFDIAESSAVKDTVEMFSTTKSSNADIAKAVKSLNSGEAKVITVGEDSDSPIAYLVFKDDINAKTKDYLKKDSNRDSVLQNMKKDEFTDFIEATTEELLKSDALAKNSGAIDKYDPAMFYEKPEETTAASDSAE